MKIFNQENSKKTKTEECVIILNWEEAKVLIEAVELAVNQNPKKKKIKSILNDLENLCVY